MTRLFTRPDACFALSSRIPIRVSPTRVTGAPEWLAGLRVLFVSDVHMRPEMNPEAVASVIASQNADLILFGGDFADDSEQALRLFRAFKELRAPLGIFACMGNNDTEAFPDRTALAAELEKFGAKLLVNESVCLNLEGGNLRIGGIDEPRHGHPVYEDVFPDTDGYRILLSHYPILPDAEMEKMPDLMLSGHTHGGQFNCLGLTPYSIGFEQTGHRKHLAPALISGEKRFGRTRLIVSKGIGMSRLPFRIGVCSEINLLTLEC